MRKGDHSTLQCVPCSSGALENALCGAGGGGVCADIFFGYRLNAYGPEVLGLQPIARFLQRNLVLTWFDGLLSPFFLPPYYHFWGLRLLHDSLKAKAC